VVRSSTPTGPLLALELDKGEENEGKRSLADVEVVDAGSICWRGEAEAETVAEAQLGFEGERGTGGLTSSKDSVAMDRFGLREGGATIVDANGMRDEGEILGEFEILCLLAAGDEKEEAGGAIEAE
jgi:hypothetical protein